MTGFDVWWSLMVANSSRYDQQRVHVHVNVNINPPQHRQVGSAIAERSRHRFCQWGMLQVPGAHSDRCQVLTPTDFSPAEVLVAHYRGLCLACETAISSMHLCTCLTMFSRTKLHQDTREVRNENHSKSASARMMHGAIIYKHSWVSHVLLGPNNQAKLHMVFVHMKFSRTGLDSTHAICMVLQRLLMQVFFF